jgi:hypothetical protein
MKRKLVIIISLFYTVLMGVLAVIYLLDNQNFKFLISISGVFCGVIPLIMLLFTKIKLNLSFLLSYILFLFCSQFLGSIRGWYGLGWWDVFLHYMSGILIAFFAIAVFERLVPQEASNNISPWFIFLYILSIATIGGVIWEFYEFSMDQLFGMTLQGGGNRDTMIDLIADTLGGLTISFLPIIKVKILKQSF